MPHASLGAAIQSAAATQPTVKSKISAGINALEAYIVSKGRSYIDEPGERSAIEQEAVKAFNAIFQLSPTDLLTGVIDGFVTSAIDKLLVYLAGAPVIPAVTPDPPAPTGATQGSAPPQ